MRTIELLSPAKDVECGVAAINHGADAVYIGAKAFGARAAAGNSIEDIAILVDYAHTFYAKVYVAINTILFDNEIKQAVALIHELYEIGVDAVIIQDLGILEFDLPPIQIHASTQLNNRTVDKVQFLENVGFSQVVLARELNVPQIKEICNSVDTPIEFFIHGALCVSYSGQCYMSQYATNRSGNRGVCSQMCRHEYSLTGIEGHENKKGHFLSLKDFHSDEKLHELVNAGVSSFKIEGRLKDVQYVKNITAYYRKKLDEIIANRVDIEASSHGEVSYTFEPNIYKSFSREYTTYFLPDNRQKVVNVKSPKAVGEYIGRVQKQQGKQITIQTTIALSNGDGLCYYKGSKLVGFRINSAQDNVVFTHDFIDLPAGTKLWRNHDTSFSKQLEQKTAHRKIPISIKLEETKIGLKVTLSDSFSNQITFEKKIEKEAAKNPDKVEANIKKQLAKLGETPFVTKDIKVQLQSPLFIPMGLLNDIRRECVQLLLEKRKEEYKGDAVAIQPNEEQYPVNEPQDCRLNISNTYSKSFFKRHGVENTQDAYELEKNDAIPLMTTKHCIRFQLDSCPKENKSIAKAEPAYIEDLTGKYKVEFDCVKCEMNIFAANN